jgi:Na+/H+ antiporter NhaD/arsenite permease-like protein
MLLTIVNHKHIAFFLPLFLFFLGLTEVTREHQNRINIREGLLVGFFLGGLVTLGGLQGWWLEGIVAALQPVALFLSATVLTAFTDNAALTYLGSLVPGLSDSARLALVGGAVAGGGLTVIANAPNPAGYGILKDSFGDGGISPLGLFLAALPATLLFMVVFAMTSRF